MLPLLPRASASPESKAILCPFGDQSGSEAFRRHGVRRSRPVPSIPTRWIADLRALLNRVNTIELPSGENWGSELKSNPAGRVVTRRASSWVTPSGSEAGVEVSLRASPPLGFAVKISLQHVPGTTPSKAIRPSLPGNVADAGAAPTAVI